MDYFYAPPTYISRGVVTIDGDEFAHITHVMRKEAGDQIRVVDGQGMAYDVTLTEIGSRSAHGTINATLPGLGEPSKKIHLGVGILKNPARFDFLVEKATELGVGRITPLTTERTIPHHSKRERWQKLALAAMKQCGRSVLPPVDDLTSFDSFLDAASSADVRLIAHEQAPATAAVPAPDSAASVAMLVGPEGGFSDDEVARAERAGFVQVTLGARRLRTETAVVVMIGKLG